MSEDEVLQNICFFPIYYRTMKLSPIALIERSGYLEMPQVLERERIAEYLRGHPQLIDAWELWAGDGHAASCKKTENGYAIYTNPDAKPIKFTDKFEAWAEVVVRATQHIAKFAYKASN